MTGYITKGIGGFYYVKTSEGIVECKPRGIFRKQKLTPVAGDVVTLETENGAAVIASIAPRRNVFVRPPMANLDVLFLVASTTQPTPSTLVLDKLSAIAVDKGVQPVIVCTKGDLAEAEFLRSAYEKSTLPFIRIDHRTGEGLDEIRNWINGRLCAFCGNSGVGKSTLLNALLPDVERETAAISQKLGLGGQTEQYSDQPVGTIISQSPGEGASAKLNTRVSVVVSAGPEPAPEPEAPSESASSSGSSGGGWWSGLFGSGSSSSSSPETPRPLFAAKLTKLRRFLR